MDQAGSLQDVLRCDVCENPVPPLYCDLCQTHLCKTCVGEHVSDESKEHTIVSFKKRRSTQKCQIHSSSICKLYCRQCDIPICTQCVSSEKHIAHNLKDILATLRAKKHVMKEDLKELKKSIQPIYKKIATKIKAQKAELNKNSRALAKSLSEFSECLHNEIDIFIRKTKSDFDKTEFEYHAALNKQGNDIKRTLSEISESIGDLKRLLHSQNLSVVNAYKSKNAEYKRLAPKFAVTFPKVALSNIKKQDICDQVGSLLALSIKTNDHGNAIDAHRGGEFSIWDTSLINEPRIITDISTEYKELRNVSCVCDEDIWTCGEDNIIRLYSLKGELVKSTQTKSRNQPQDIAVTISGDLVYTDNDDRTLNIVRNTDVNELIRLMGWIPWGVCCTTSGDLLVVMDSEGIKRTKVVRYSGSTEKQRIEYDEKGQPLYSYGYTKYISENRNLNICVSDYTARAVVVVDQAGKLRFKYTGFQSNTQESFRPYGISTDSQSQILTVDSINNFIHILDQDGQFLRLIDNCDLYSPSGICVDTKDNLFVTEYDSGKVKKILYM